MENNIIAELGLEELDEETQADILTKMTESVIKRIAITVLEKLQEEDRVVFENLQEQADADKMEAFLKEKIENYEEMVGQIVSDFKKEMKESINNLRKELS